MTSREELITLINHISDEHADKLLASARIMVTLQKRCGRTKPSVTEKSLCDIACYNPCIRNCCRYLAGDIPYLRLKVV